MRRMALLVSVCLYACALSAQQPGVARGSTIFIEKMENDFDGYIRAEMVRQKVPLTIVLDQERATLVMTGAGQRDPQTSWHEGWLTSSKNHATGTISIVDQSTKALVWAGQAGDKGFWTNNGGPGRVAKKIVGQLKHVIR